MESEAVSDSRPRVALGVTPGRPSPTPIRPKAKGRMSHETRILLLTLASGTAAVGLSLILLWAGDHASDTRWSLTLLILMLWLGFAFGVRGAVVRPLQTLSNINRRCGRAISPSACAAPEAEMRSAS